MLANRFILEVEMGTVGGDYNGTYLKSLYPMTSAIANQPNRGESALTTRYMELGKTWERFY